MQVVYQNNIQLNHSKLKSPMLSPIRKNTVNPYTQLAGNLIELVIQAHVNIQQKQKCLKQNVEHLALIQQEAKSLEQQNFLLGELQEALINVENICLDLNKDYENTQLNQAKQMKGKQKQSQIQVILPDLTNLQQYFQELTIECTLEKYLNMKDMDKVEEAKHMGNMMKLTEKLKNVDMKVNQTLAMIKNQRRHL